MINKFFIYLVICMAIACVCGYLCLYIRWRNLWAQNKPLQMYKVAHSEDDTLRIVMIGDSWAKMHKDYDDYFLIRLQSLMMCPIQFESNGKGGERTKGIYHLMFEEGENGTKPLFSNGPDYCIISAGINDAAANLGTDQYCYYYCQIIDLLLHNNIKPVIIEFPNVDIWTIYKNKPIKDLFVDYLRSTMTHCSMYAFKEYRESLRSMLIKKKLIEHILYIPLDSWHGDSDRLNMNLFLKDHIHLNRKGYMMLDDCLAQMIVNDSKMMYKPVYKDTHN